MVISSKQRPDAPTQQYQEADVRRWLGNIATALKMRGHSTLLLEQLQPGMLPRRREKIQYVVITRCLAGLIVGLTAGALHHSLFIGTAGMAPGTAAFWGFGAGLATAIAAIVKLSGRILERFPIDSWVWQNVFRAVLGSLVAAVGVTAVELVYVILGAAEVIDSQPITRDQLVLMGLIAVLTGLLGLRTMGRAFTDDIESIETLGLSWSNAIPGIVAGGLVSMGLAYIYVEFIREGFDDVAGQILLAPEFSESRSTMLQYIVITVVGIVVGGTFHGLVPQTRKHKSRPNQGIMLTARYCLRTGLGLGLFAGVLWGWCVYRTFSIDQGGDSSEIIGLVEQLVEKLGLSVEAERGAIAGIYGGAGVYVVAGIWFGGLDVMRHYVLRVLLAHYRYVPLRLVPFLNYVEKELTFLNRVGGGYRFFHRYLQEYFENQLLTESIETNAAGERGSGAAE